MGDIGRRENTKTNKHLHQARCSIIWIPAEPIIEVSLL